MIDNVAPIAPEGHPVYTLMIEHQKLVGFADELIEVALQLKGFNSYDSAAAVMAKLQSLIAHFKDSEKHYLREENVIFPYLEKHGVTGPPQVMWMEHDQIRDLKKKLYPLVDHPADYAIGDFAAQLETLAKSLQALLSNHFFKENHILFPAAMEQFSDDEWKEALRQFSRIGYCGFSPPVAGAPEEDTAGFVTAEGEIPFETGALSPPIIEAMLNTLPVEITFIDADDTVRYFSQPAEMIFIRSAAIIGAQVQNCHPQKSVHLVNKIVEAFRRGERDVAEFWIDMDDKKVYIRYFAVRDKKGTYLGCMEVTQNIAPLQKITGQKRLLDWS